MKTKLLMFLPIAALAIGSGVVSCAPKNKESSKIDNNTSYSMIVKPNTSYLSDSKSKLQMFKMNSVEFNEDNVYATYDFTIDDDVFKDVKPDYLLKGANPLLVTPYVKATNGSSISINDNYTSKFNLKKAADVTTDEYTTDEFKKMFSDFTTVCGTVESYTVDETLYGVEQTFQCWAIGSSDGAKLSSCYYNVSVTVVDEIGPVLFNSNETLYSVTTEDGMDVLDLSKFTEGVQYVGLTYSTTFSFGLYNHDYVDESITDSEKTANIEKYILDNYNDNDENSKLVVKYYLDTNFTEEATCVEALSHAKSAISVPTEHLPSSEIYYKVFDISGNSSKKSILKFSFVDNEKPKICYSNGTEVYITYNWAEISSITKEDFSIKSIDDIKSTFMNEFYDYVEKNNMYIADDVSGKLTDYLKISDTYLFQSEESYDINFYFYDTYNNIFSICAIWYI